MMSLEDFKVKFHRFNHNTTCNLGACAVEWLNSDYNPKTSEDRTYYPSQALMFLDTYRYPWLDA